MEVILGYKTVLLFKSRQTPAIEVLIEGLIRGPHIKVSVRVNDKGRSVYAEEDVKEGEFVLEYRFHTSYKR